MIATILFKTFLDESEHLEASDCGNNHCIAVDFKIKPSGDAI